MIKYKFFGFPYSGGTGTYYLRWTSMLNNIIKIIPIEYPGRGKRFVERLCESMQELIDDLYDKYKSELDDTDYAVFGHSLGGLVAYEFVCRIIKNGYKPPVHMFLSGCNPPNIKDLGSMIHTMPDHEFLEAIIKSGGMTNDILANKEVLDLFIPIIRNDYKIYETYQPEHAVRLPVDFSVLVGNDDHMVTLDNARKWQDYTTKGCVTYAFKGGHFFINDNAQTVVKLINERLT